VGELADRCASAFAESARLAGEMAVRDRRIAQLEGELQRLQQARHDIAKRIDDMIGQIDQLETQLVARAE
jgi:predicted  nucleic acid-binding Zn-ribbon protein